MKIFEIETNLSNDNLLKFAKYKMAKQLGPLAKSTITSVAHMLGRAIVFDSEDLDLAYVINIALTDENVPAALTEIISKYLAVKVNSDEDLKSKLIKHHSAPKNEHGGYLTSKQMVAHNEELLKPFIWKAIFE